MTEIIMPKMGLSEADVTLAAWLVKEGDTVKAGDEIAELEAEKISNNLEVQVSGTISKLCIEEGDEVAIGTVIAIVED